MDGTENSHQEDASNGMERYTALMSDGGRAGKLDLLLHLLANLPRPVLLLGPSGAGKTSLLRQVQSRALENWTTCYLTASPSLSLDWVCLQLLEVLRQGHRAGAEATPETQLETELASLAKRNGRLILLLDDAGQVLPGLLGAICQFVRLHPEIQLAFALKNEDLAQKATSDPLALADAHMIEVSPLRREVTPTAAPLRVAAPQAARPSLTKAFLSAFTPRKGRASNLAGPVVITLLSAATVAGFVVQALWRAESEPQPPAADVKTEATSQPSVAPAQLSAALPEVTPSPEPSPSAIAPNAVPALAESQPPPTAEPEPSVSPIPSPTASPAPSATPAPAAETPAPSPALAVEAPPPTASPSPAPTPAPAAIEDKAFPALFASLPTSKAPVYASLFELWGAAPQKPVGDECAYAKTKRLRCQNLRADWQTLQTYNRPAALEVAQGNARRYLALVGIEGDKALVDLNGQTVRIPLSEIQPQLRGEAVILWKPPFDKASIGTRERHETSRWIRERLQIPAAPGQELVYDEQVKAKVLAFQKQKGLLADGRAGALTLLQIQLLGDEPQSPKLTQPSSLSAPATGTP